MEIIEELENGKIVLKIDKSLYSHEAIVNTTYKFTDSCYLRVLSFDSDNYGVYLTPKTSETDVKSLINKFLNSWFSISLRKSKVDQGGFGQFGPDGFSANARVLLVTWL